MNFNNVCLKSKGFLLVIVSYVFITPITMAAAELRIFPFLAEVPQHRLDQGPLRQRTNITIFLEFVNTSSKLIRVATGNRFVSFVEQWSDDNRIVGGRMIYGGPSERHGFSGKVIVPLQSELNIVELKPDESAQIEIEVAVPAKVDLRNVQFEYLVDRQLGERFGVWFGMVSSELLKQVPVHLKIEPTK